MLSVPGLGFSAYVVGKDGMDACSGPYNTYAHTYMHTYTSFYNSPDNLLPHSGLGTREEYVNWSFWLTGRCMGTLVGANRDRILAFCGCVKESLRSRPRRRSIYSNN